MVVRNLRRFAVPAFNHEYPLMSQIIGRMDKPELLYLAGLFMTSPKAAAATIRCWAPRMRDSSANHRPASGRCRRGGLAGATAPDHVDRGAERRHLRPGGDCPICRQLARTPERLAALYLLTVADIRGTSPKVWNAWKGKLLEDLYHATLHVLRRDGIDTRTLLSERESRRRNRCCGWRPVPEGVENRLWKHLDDVYFMRHEPQDIAWRAVCSTGWSTPPSRWSGRASRSHEGVEVLVYCRTSPTSLPPVSGLLGHTSLRHYPPTHASTPPATAMPSTPSCLPARAPRQYRDMINFVRVRAGRRPDSS